MDLHSPTDWHARARALTLDGRQWVDGRRMDALAGDRFLKHSPVDGRSLGLVCRGQQADVDQAVASARRAFADGRWRRQPPRSRKQVLQRWSALVLAAREELALLETLDMGKPIGHALTVDIPSCATCLAWFGEAIDKRYGEVAPTGDDALALVTREPVGVVGAIVPWNYPLLMAAWKLGPALAAGNSVVLKPSEKSPFSALCLAELALDAGVPPGVLNVVPGFGTEAGEALALHPDVDALCFTGSTRVGRRVLACAAESNLKRVYNELGGKSAFIVFDDAPDMAKAARAAATGVYFNQGETCNAPTRVLVQRRLVDEFVDRLVAESARFGPGDPLDERCPMGALVDAAQQESVLGHVQRARQEGARLVCGGRSARPGSGGFYVEPTVFANVHNGMRIAREEIFGPVLSVIAFDTEQEAVAIANDSPYGLQAGLWTRSLDRAHSVARALQAGTVHVNQYDDDDITVPFGGVKQSGNGRDKSLHAFDKVTELKTTWMHIGAT